ncbi:small serum protein 2-like [Erythrolamprus reginae]|uniref:small serum protein 2-like n=1 Tax=Erythrolamprus reginae TaxID=121349 RepID=UPI00396CD11C
MGGEDSVPTSERRAAPGLSILPRVSWVSPKANMKIFLSLILFSLMLTTCQAACFVGPYAPAPYDDTCADDYDGRKHLIGSTWNTPQCERCECGNNGLLCCDRYGNLTIVEGCRTVRNPVTCEYEHYRFDDPTQRCNV